MNYRPTFQFHKTYHTFNHLWTGQPDLKKKNRLNPHNICFIWWPIWCNLSCHVMFLDQQKIKNWVSKAVDSQNQTDTHKFREQHSFRIRPSYFCRVTSSKDCWLFTPFFLEMIELIREWNKCICVCVRAHFRHRRKEGIQNSPRCSSSSIVIINMVVEPDLALVSECSQFRQSSTNSTLPNSHIKCNNWKIF